MEHPEMMEWPELMARIPKDVITRVQKYLSSMSGLGPYSDSRGAIVLREAVARGISRRDGYPANPNEIYMTGTLFICLRLPMGSCWSRNIDPAGQNHA